MTRLDGPQGVASWTWLDNQALGAQTLPNGAYTQYTYLPDGRLSSLTNKDDGGSVLSRYEALVYAGTGDVVARSDEVTGESGLTGELSWGYDHRRQLTAEESDVR